MTPIARATRQPHRVDLPLHHLHCSHRAFSGPESQLLSIRLTEHADLLVRDEVKRSGRSRSAVVEELAEEVAKARLFPGVASRGTPRRAWVIGTGLDVWEILELLRSYAHDEQQLRAAHPCPANAACASRGRTASAFPDEIAAFADDARRPLDELQRLSPFASGVSSASSEASWSIVRAM
jgi:hypothetical protein